jgi:hypothetical protein
MHRLFISFFCSIGFIISFPTLADPNTVEIGISCPDASGGGYNSLSNFGGRIAGYGKESINSIPAPHSPYFSYLYTTGHFPSNLAMGAYTNSGVDYDPTNALVICKFNSGNGYDSINVTYQMTNGKGGVVQSQAQNEIVILQYLGLRKG